MSISSFGRAVAEPPAGGPKSTYIVQFRSGTDPAERAAAARAAGVQVNAVWTSALNGLSAELDSAQAADWQRDPAVVAVEADDSLTATADITETNATWGLDRIDDRDLALDTSYVYGRTGKGLKVYVFDSGIVNTLSDLSGRIDAGADFILDGKGTTDCNGHGSHVAGTIAGSIYGVAKEARIIPVRVLGCKGTGTTTQLINGINWLIAKHVSGPAIANLSLGFSTTVSAVDTAVRNLVADGVLVTTAAGNSSGNACNFSPSDVKEALVVAATDGTDTRSSSSNYGSCVDLFAPGVNITSLNYAVPNGGTTVMSGSSMAAPHVTGIAALIWAANPTLTVGQVTAQLLAGATPGRVLNPGTGTPNLFAYSGA